jgi:ubiquinol-cytochrome c reductase cytochrome b subunit
VYYSPNTLGHPDNYIPANPMSTPEHIVPEWYFLPAYAILRSIPNKLLGVLALFAAVLILLFIPYITTTRITSANFRPAYRIGFWFFLIIWGILVWLGGEHVEEPYITLSQVFTVLYFRYFLFFLPIVGKIEEVLEIKKVKHSENLR